MEKLSILIDQKITGGKKPVYAKHEWQEFGVRLAQDLKDLKHKVLYIKLAKEEKRSFLLKARDFAIDYSQARSRAKVFMWALQQLKKFGTIKPDNNPNGDKPKD